MIRFFCEDCGKAIRVAVELLPQQEQCPGCGVDLGASDEHHPETDVRRFPSCDHHDGFFPVNPGNN